MRNNLNPYPLPLPIPVLVPPCLSVYDTPHGCVLSVLAGGTTAIVTPPSPPCRDHPIYIILP